MRVRPANPDAVIRDPRTRRPLPAEGAEVKPTSYWTRRLRSGEVVEVKEESDERPTGEFRPMQRASLPGVHPPPGVPTGLEPTTPLTTREPGAPSRRLDEGDSSPFDTGGGER